MCHFATLPAPDGTHEEAEEHGHHPCLAPLSPTLKKVYPLKPPKLSSMVRVHFPYFFFFFFFFAR
jgi:hypothetical protein